MFIGMAVQPHTDWALLMVIALVVVALTVGWLAGTYASGRDLTCVTLVNGDQIGVSCYKGQSSGGGA